MKVRHSAYLSFLNQEDKDRYSRWLNRSYLEKSQNVKFCSDEHCDHFFDFNSSDIYTRELTCPICFTTTCSRCGQEAHGPAFCEMVQDWVETGIDE